MLAVIPVLSRNTGYVPHLHLDFFYSNKNHLVQLEDTTIKTERGCSMQHTERTTVTHHRSDFIYHTWGEWVELTDKNSEVRQTRRVRWDRQDDGRRVSKRNVKVPVLKIFWILKSLLTSAINPSQWFSTFFPPGRTMVQVQVSLAARMSFTYYVINTNQPDL